MKLADKLVYLRKKQGLSQLKLAEMMNVSRQAVSRWETGIAVPSAENLKYLGNLYMLLYNQKKGKNVKGFFYWYYPIHRFLIIITYAMLGY